jgi:type II secretory pathway pseudopilin PulG
MRRRARHQSGYMLLAILLMMTLMIIAAMAVAPKLASQIKREREQELYHRGSEYARAIRRFYRKFGRYPTSIDQLENTNNMRFLRKRYKDPITGKDDWTLIHVGQSKNPLNLFGTAASGAGSSASGLGGSTASSAFGIPTPQPSNVGTPAAQMGTPAGGTGTGTGTSGGTQGSAFGGTFGGGPIIGVASPSEAESLMEIQGKSHYNEWEFVYDPRFDRQAAGTGGGLALPGMGAPPPPTGRGPLGGGQSGGFPNHGPPKPP